MSTRLKSRYILFLILLMANKIGFAQNNTTTYQLSGKVVDSLNHEPLPLITIRLSTSKGAPLRALVTKDSGTFVFSKLPAGSYQLTILAVGYQQKNYTVDPAKYPHLDLIYLKPQTNALKEVTIATNRPVIQQKSDRIIYDLQADPESKGSSVLTMMRKIPFVSLDGNDQVLLKGNNSYRILINGKPSSMLNGNLTTILRSMPAATIQKIEVITTPSTKYDAEGLGGIINIITNKKEHDGYNGTINMNESGPAGGPGTGASFTAKLGKFGISAFGGASIYNAPETSFSNSRTSIGAITTNLHQEGHRQSNQRNGYLGTQLSYEIDALNLISSQLNLSGNRNRESQNFASILTGTNLTNQAYDLESHNEASSFGIDAALNYQLGFKSAKNKFLTFSYQYSSNPTDQQTAVDFYHQINQNNPNYRQSGQAKFKEQTAQMDFVNQVKMVKIEAGLKAIFRKNTSNFKYDSLNKVNGQFEQKSSLSDQYLNTQNVFSAYNTYLLALKQWNISLGMRYEHTMIRADFISSGALANQDYNNIVPAIAVSKNFKNESSLNFGWSQRIRRPGINRLNPYTDRTNPNLESTGNPNLRPVLTNSLQAGFNRNKKLAVNIGLDYSFMNNLDLKVTNYDPESQITSITYANVGKAKSMGVNFNLGYPIAKWYQVGMNGQVMYLWLSGPSDGLLIHNDRCIYFIALSNAFQVSGGWRINADMTIIGPNPNGLQGTSNGVLSTAFGLSKEVVKNKLGFAAGIKNPFTRHRSRQDQWFGANFQQFSSSSDYFRSFSISLNYNFGGLKDGVRKSKNEIRNNDLSN